MEIVEDFACESNFFHFSFFFHHFSPFFLNFFFHFFIFSFFHFFIFSFLFFFNNFFLFSFFSFFQFFIFLSFFVADVVKSFDIVDRGILDRVLSSLFLPGWFRHAYFEYHAHVRMRFKLASGLGQSWTRDGCIPQACPLSMMFIVALYLPWCRYLSA